MNKGGSITTIIGYIIAIIGLALLAIGLVNEIRNFVADALKINISQTNDVGFIIAGLIIIIIGIYLVLKSPNLKTFSKHKEVPIYHGNKIVGYRRH